jgi:hypothetical protein
MRRTGICPVCKRGMTLTKAGTLRHHGGEVGANGWSVRRSYRCDGSGQKPAAVAP